MEVLDLETEEIKVWLVNGITIRCKIDEYGYPWFDIKTPSEYLSSDNYPMVGLTLNGKIFNYGFGSCAEEEF